MNRSPPRAEHLPPRTSPALGGEGARLATAQYPGPVHLAQPLATALGLVGGCEQAHWASTGSTSQRPQHERLVPHCAESSCACRPCAEPRVCVSDDGPREAAPGSIATPGPFVRPGRSRCS
eukprot:scaffold1974_cov395-Prasinococcus_capsulatus_cf.AAC.3